MKAKYIETKILIKKPHTISLPLDHGTQKTDLRKMGTENGDRLLFLCKYDTKLFLPPIYLYNFTILRITFLLKIY